MFNLDDWEFFRLCHVLFFVHLIDDDKKTEQFFKCLGLLVSQNVKRASCVHLAVCAWLSSPAAIIFESDPLLPRQCDSFTLSLSVYVLTRTEATLSGPRLAEISPFRLIGMCRAVQFYDPFCNVKWNLWSYNAALKQNNNEPIRVKLQLGRNIIIMCLVFFFCTASLDNNVDAISGWNIKVKWGSGEKHTCQSDVEESLLLPYDLGTAIIGKMIRVSCSVKK